MIVVNFLACTYTVHCKCLRVCMNTYTCCAVSWWPHTAVLSLSHLWSAVQHALQKFDEADKSVNINKGAASAPAPHASTAQPQQLDQTAPGDPQHPSSSQPDVTQQQQQQPGHQVELHAGREVSRLVLRTVFFDEATLVAAGQPAPRSGKALAAVLAHIQQHTLPPCTQVGLVTQVLCEV